MKLTKFVVEEFVPRELYNLMGDHAICCMDEELITFIINLRQTLNRPITINTWKWGGRFTSRGIRLPGSTYYSATSQHSEGKALDFDVAGMPASEVRSWIISNRDLVWVKPITFIEDGVNWVHIDVGLTHGRSKDKLILWHVKTKNSVVYTHN